MDMPRLLSFAVRHPLRWVATVLAFALASRVGAEEVKRRFSVPSDFAERSLKAFLQQSAPGGVLNYITKKPQYRPAGELTLRVGSSENYKAVFDSTGPLVKNDDLALAYRVVGTWQDAKAVRDFEYREGHYLSGVIEARVRKATTLRFRVEHQILDRLDSVSAPYLWTPAPAVTNPPDGVPIVAPGFLLNLPATFSRAEPDDFADVETFRYEGTWEQRLGAHWSARAVASFTDSTSIRSESAILAQTNQFPVFTRRKTDRTLGADTIVLDLSVVGEFEFGPTRHQLLFGATYLDDESYQYGANVPLTPNLNVFSPVRATRLAPNLLVNSVGTDQSEALFVQDQIKLFSDRLHVIGGLRYDDTSADSLNQINGSTSSRTQDNVSPRYSVLWRASEGLSIYYAYNETFRPATNRRQDGSLFDPPTTETNEVGAKIELFEKKLVGSVAVFKAELGNQFRVNPNVLLDPLQTSFESRGVEVDAVYQPNKNWQLLGGIGFLDTEITKSDENPAALGNRLGSQPRLSFNFWGKYNIPSGPLEGLSLGAGLNHRRDRYESDNNAYKLPDYTIVQLLARYSWQRYSVSINVENLFDEHYVAVSDSARFTVFGEPRRIFGSFTARW